MPYGPSEGFRLDELQRTLVEVDTVRVSGCPDAETTHAGRAPGTAGLGAITVIFATIFAYATTGGLLIAVDGLWRTLQGETGTTRLILGMILLAPAALVCAHVFRRRSRRIL